MRTKDYLIFSLCLIVNVLVLCFVIIKTGWLNKTELESASLITTTLGFAVAVLALIVSYVTFQSQSKSSKESQNLVLLSHVTSELNEIRRALDTSSITDDNGKYYGIDAIMFFMANYIAGNSTPPVRLQLPLVDFIGSNHPQASLYTSQVLSQLNRLVRLANYSQNFPFTYPFDVRAKGYITLAVDDFMKFHEAIFSRIKEALSGRQVGQYNFETGALRFYLDVDQEHDKLLKELLNLGYLIKVETRQATGEQFADALNSRRENLQRRINEVMEVNYKTNKI